MKPESLRGDFPLLQRENPPIYFDNACMTLRPHQVIEAVNRYYTDFPACGGRSNHRLAKRVNDEAARAREAIRRLINAKKAQEIIFQKNTTEGLNTVLSGLGWKSGDLIVSSDKEHNSMLLPIQRLKSRGVKHVTVPTSGAFSMASFEKLAMDARLVAIVGVSNMDGGSLPVRDIVRIAHRHGARVLLDAAQMAPHQELDVRGLDVDFAAFSGHKMLGPSSGVLYGKEEHLLELSPLSIGGGTVNDSHYDSFDLAKLPDRLEAGLQDYAGIIGLGAAADYLRRVGLGNIERHEKQLTRRLSDGISAMRNVRILGPPAKERSGITSFIVEGVDHHQVAMLLDSVGNICVRSGQHCVHSWFNANNLTGSVRASLYLYNTEDEVDRFIAQLSAILAQVR